MTESAGIYSLLDRFGAAVSSYLHYVILSPAHSPHFAVAVTVLAADTAMTGTVRDIGVRRREICGTGCSVLGFVQAGFAAETGFGLIGE